MPRPSSPAPRNSATSPARTAFRVTAIVEACTWVGLLIGMAFKYLISGGEAGVHVFGPLHGAAFVSYCLATLWAARTFGWSRGVTVLGLAAAIPPLGSWAFESWTLCSGRLEGVGAPGAEAPAPAV